MTRVGGGSPAHGRIEPGMEIIGAGAVTYLEDKLVTVTGDPPSANAGMTTVVGKNDGKGWPWRTFYAPERWAALVNDENRGVGLFQPDTCTMIGGFAGGDGRL